jgi:transposase
MGVADHLPTRPDNAKQVRDDILSVLRQSPREWEFDRSRWRLRDLLEVVSEWLAVTSVSGLWRVCQRLGIQFRRGWEFWTSPDPFAAEKLAWIEDVCQQAAAKPDNVVVLWMDELTVYLSPSPAPTWGSQQGRARKAHQATKDETYRRIVATLDHSSGQVRYHLRKKIGKKALREFYPYIRRQYPDAERIYVIQDCCPTHFLDEVCQAAEDANITMVPLPTYSSWRNYIEQLWRWLKQDVIHMHPWSGQWALLEDAIRCFLDRFRQPNTSLLRYVGLCD